MRIPRNQKGEKNGSAKLNEYQIKRIRLIKKITPSLKYKEMAKIFNITSVTISDIVRKNTWKHI